jgi:hypothetical protein
MNNENSMNESSEFKRGLNRRDVLKGVAAVSLGLVIGAYGAPQESAPSPRSNSPGRDLIRRENAKPGTRDWMLTKTDIDDKEPVELWRSPRIEGYCSETSVSDGVIAPGEYDDASQLDDFSAWTPEFFEVQSREDLYAKVWLKHDGQALYEFFEVQSREDPRILRHRLWQCLRCRSELCQRSLCDNLLFVVALAMLQGRD